MYLARKCLWIVPNASGVKDVQATWKEALGTSCVSQENASQLMSMPVECVQPLGGITTAHEQLILLRTSGVVHYPVLLLETSQLARKSHGH